MGLFSFLRKKEPIPSFDMIRFEMEKENNHWLQDMSDRDIQHQGEVEALRMVNEYEMSLIEHKRFMMQNNIKDMPFIPLILNLSCPTIKIFYNTESKWDSQSYEAFVITRYKELKKHSSIVSMYNKCFS